MPAYQGLAFMDSTRQPVQTYYRAIRSSSAELTAYCSYVNFETRSAWN